MWRSLISVTKIEITTIGSALWAIIERKNRIRISSAPVALLVILLKHFRKTSIEMTSKVELEAVVQACTYTNTNIYLHTYVHTSITLYTHVCHSINNFQADHLKMT